MLVDFFKALVVGARATTEINNLGAENTGPFHDQSVTVVFRDLAKGFATASLDGHGLSTGFVRIRRGDPVVSKRSVGLEEFALFLLVRRGGGTFLVGLFVGHLGAELGDFARHIVAFAATGLDTVRFAVVDVIARSTVYLGVQIIKGVETDAVGFSELFTRIGAGGYKKKKRARLESGDSLV